MNRREAADARTLRVMIVDDERLGRERLLSLLTREPDVDIVDECASGVEALRALMQSTPSRRPDLIFLDIQMPDLDGVEVAQALVEMSGDLEVPELIFVTAFSEYMERAFELHAIDYLRKPYTDARFASALAYARGRILDRRRATEAEHEPARGAPKDPERLRRLLDTVSLDRVRRRIALRDRATGTLTFIDASEIAWVEADGPGRVLLHSRSGARPWAKGIEAAEHELAPLGFMRVHRSYLVHPDHLVEIKELPKGQYMLTLPNGKRFDTGRTFAANLERLLAGIPGGR